MIDIVQKLRFMADDGEHMGVNEKTVDVASLRQAVEEIERLRTIAELARKARWIGAACWDLADGSGVFISAESMKRFDEVFNELGVALGETIPLDEEDERAQFDGPAKLLERAKAAEAERDALRAEMQRVWDHVQRVSPWSESNDMTWSGEVGAGINLLAMDRDMLRARIESAPLVTLTEGGYGPGGTLEIDEIFIEKDPDEFRAFLDKRVRLVIEEEKP